MSESYNTNLTNVAVNYIKALKVPVTITSLQQQLTQNPFYPSLYSLSNTLDRFHIPHEAYKIEDDNFEQLTPPFIAYLKNQSTGKDFVLVTLVTRDAVSYISEGQKVKTITKQEFLKNWERIVLQASPDANSGEKDYKVNRKKEIANSNTGRLLIISAIFLFALTLGFFFNSLPGHFAMSAGALLTIKLLGLSATILLLIYETDKSNAFVKSICTAGKQTNCSAVLKSKAAKIFGMSWSEAGFFYFASTFLFLLLPGILYYDQIAALSIANCLAAPYIVFSIYYQWKIVKQWCPLCLTVQGVLFVELIWSVVNFWMHPFLLHESPVGIGLSIAFCIALPMVVWFTIKPLILKAKDEVTFKAAYKRLQYNPDTFNHLLQQQPTAPDGYEDIGITIGNPHAANTIIKVCNPYCGPCAKAHLIIHEIVEQNKDVKLKLIFTATNSEDDVRGMVAKHLLAISSKKDSRQTAHALDEWYLSSGKDYEGFARKYPLNGELKKQGKQIDEMKEWCDEAAITGTPTFFINGRQLPESYSISELKYIL